MQPFKKPIWNLGYFVAGTVVATNKELVPIQDSKVGDMVLSKPEFVDKLREAGLENLGTVKNTVFNIKVEENVKVEENHTCFLGNLGLWIHNTSSLPQMLLQTAQEIANGTRPIGCGPCIKSLHNTGSMLEQLAKISID